MDEQLTRLLDNQNYQFDQQSIVYSHSQFLRLITDNYIRDIKSGRKRIEDFYRALQDLSSEDARSLLYIDNFLLNKSWENISYNSDDYKRLLISQLRKYERPVEQYNYLIEFKATSILPEAYLDWFKDDLRCSLFLMSLIQDTISNESYKGRKALLTGATNFLRYHIPIFNNNASPYNYANNIVREGDWKVAHLLSVKSTYLKGRTKNRELKWLDVSNHEQIEWACDYLEKNKYTILKDVFFPETIEEKYELILASLDRLSNIESDDIGTEKHKGYSLRSYVLFSIRKAWDGQKQYDAKSKTSDGIIKIYKKNQPKLDELAKKNNITANQIINKYIEDAHKNMLSLDSQNEKQVSEYIKPDKDDKKTVNISSKNEVLPDSNSIKPTTEITSSIGNKNRHHSMSVTTPRKKVFPKPIC